MQSGGLSGKPGAHVKKCSTRLSIFLVRRDGEVNKNKRAHVMTLAEIGMHLKLSTRLDINLQNIFAV